MTDTNPPQLPPPGPPAIERPSEVVTIHEAAPDSRGDEATTLAESLTAREREVAIAVGRGASNAEIAADLHMSVATVKAHISHIFTKLEVTNRVQVAICMHDAGTL